MFSTYLNQEIPLTEKTATLEGGKQQIIVLHSELEDIIVNRLRGVVRYDYPVVIPSMTDAVVTCRMGDDKNGYITAIGEATANTLTSGIADNYPTTTAANRAFDRAAIRFLGLGHVYSNLEIAPDGPKRYDSKNLVDAPDSTTTQQNQEQADSVNDPSPAPTHKEPAQPKNAAPANEPQNTSSATVENDDGNVVISIGKYAGKGKTVAEIYAEDLSWLQYVTSNISAKKPEMVQQLECAKRYIAAHEGK